MSIDKEKVRELLSQIECCEYVSEQNQVIQEWLEKNKPEPVVVGLSDFQIKQLTTWFVCEKPKVNSPAECHAVITKYLATQTFAQPVHFSSIELSEMYQGIYEDFEQVKKEYDELKSQQIKPSWNDAPEWANWLAHDKDGGWNWFDEKPRCQLGASWVCNNYGRFMAAEINPDWQQTLEQRPAPKVEVGQVWKLNKTEVEVIALNDDDVVFQKKATKGFDVYSIIDFITKFERVK